MRACDTTWDMRITQEQLRAMYERNPALARVNQLLGPGTETPGDWCCTVTTPVKLSKYRNVKVEYEGMKFDSKHELKCWQNLKLREKAGEIGHLERQVKFDLVVNGKKVGKFTADFVWYEPEQVVADAKSEITRKETAYRLRKKLFEALYAPLAIKEL